MTLKIGNVELENNVILAPMAGVTDMPYRILCREQGAGLVCMEMVSAKAILYKNKNTQELLKVDERERPVSLQLFGSDPDIVADIAASLEDGPYDIFDINMGCPVPKIVKNGEGSALMRNPKLVEEILTKLVKAVKKPVTVKFRKGFDDTCINAVEIAKIAESAGVAAVAVHGRTREQYYSGKADWNIIREVKKAVKIPVIGNGDVFTPQDAKRLVEETGCDGIMVARGAKGNPWIFKQITPYLETGELLPSPSVEELKAMILRHGQMMMEFKGELAGMREMRKHVAWYTAGYPNSAALRNEINSVATLEELTELIGDIRSADAGTVRLGAFTSVAVHWLPGMIRTFQSAHPKAELKMFNGDYHDMEQWLREGEVDLGFVTLPAPEGMRTIPLTQDPLVAIMPKNHRLAQLDEIPIQKLGEDPFISLLQSSAHDIHRALDNAGVRPNIKFTTKDDYAILAMVEQGLGISIVPQLLIQGRTQNLAVRPLKPRASRTIALAIPEGKPLPVVEAFAQTAVAWVNEQSGK